MHSISIYLVLAVRLHCVGPWKDSSEQKDLALTPEGGGRLTLRI